MIACRRNIVKKPQSTDLLCLRLHYISYQHAASESHGIWKKKIISKRSSCLNEWPIIRANKIFRHVPVTWNDKRLEKMHKAWDRLGIWSNVYLLICACVWVMSVCKDLRSSDSQAHESSEHPSRHTSETNRVIKGEQKSSLVLFLQFNRTKWCSSVTPFSSWHFWNCISVAQWAN